MIDKYPTSRHIDHLDQDRTLRAVYGYIIDILSMNDQDYYIPLVGPEETFYSVDTQCNYIPLDESPEQLAANYGSPRDLIGLRVRVEYYGIRWKTGTARIVPGKQRQPVGNLTEVPSRGFRFAVAGGGGA